MHLVVMVVGDRHTHYLLCEPRYLFETSAGSKIFGAARARGQASHLHPLAERVEGLRSTLDEAASVECCTR